MQHSVLHAVIPLLDDGLVDIKSLDISNDFPEGRKCPAIVLSRARTTTLLFLGYNLFPYAQE